MALCSQSCLLILVVVLLAVNVPCLLAMKIKSTTFLSPMIVLGSGSVVDGKYYDIDFPRGHIALKSFYAEVVDEVGNSVPLYETYLHHWLLLKYFQRGNATINETSDPQQLIQSDIIMSRNSGICQLGVHGQYVGLGSETRKTARLVPDPYGIEIGNPAEIPAEHKERWLLNVHAIDLRGVEDKLGCMECRCNLYNVTVDEVGLPLKPGYEGGRKCCYDKTQCKLRQGVESVERNLYLRYTVQWADWDDTIIPVKIFLLDVTDDGKRADGKVDIGCQIEYDVHACDAKGEAVDKCTHTKSTRLTLPSSGYLVYGVAHQHTGGIGLGLYREDGNVICSSLPIYGEGEVAGNEAGFIVGMSTCYPEPGSVQIAAGENLVMESNYSNSEKHIGVMGNIYLLVAEQTPKHMP